MGAMFTNGPDRADLPAIAVAHHLAEHDGIVTTEQALACGFTADRIRAKRRSGLWVPQSRGVFLSLEHPLHDAARIRTIAAAKNAVIDRTSAAWWHGLLREHPGAVTASVPRTTNTLELAGVPADLRRRTYPGEDLMTVRGVPVTGPALSILGAASMLDNGLDFLDRMIQKEVVTVPELTDALDRNRGSGGLGTARKLLKIAAGASEFEAERLFVRLIHGFAFHRYEDRWNRYLHKANVAAGAGYLPLPYSWQNLNAEREESMTQVARAVASRRAELS